MCGIAGILDTTGAPTPVADLNRMLAALRHRGPDDSGEYFSRDFSGIALGQTRLAIVDLSPAGHQPMTNERQDCWLVCNGEIYNHRTLRQRLQNRHQFRGLCDVETLLHLYEDHGADFLPSLNGMFAFALWDEKRRRLVLARDRFGVKPLYYAWLGGRFVFASEAKAILELPDARTELDSRALSEHFTWQWTTGAKTWFKGISQLEPGQYMVVSADGAVQGPKSYFRWDYHEDETLSASEWREQLQSRFENAVTAQTMSDVPVGAYLSGGMDTGSITAVASRSLPNLNTFTCGFEGPRLANDVGDDERGVSWDLAHQLHVQHREFVLTPDRMAASIDSLIWHLEYPVVGISYQIYELARFVRKHVTVVLSGTGGDELFAGYPWRYEPILHIAPQDFASKYYQLWTRFLNDEEKQSLFQPEIARELAGYSTQDRFNEVLKPSAGWAPLHRALHFDAHTFLQGLLHAEDRLTMAHGLESRVPFLDNDLLDLLLAMPSRYKARQGEAKKILKEAMARFLPADVLTRKKQGFTPPEQTWFKGQNRAFIHETLLGPTSRLKDILRPEKVRQILHEFETDQKNHRQLIWSFLLLERWCRVYLEKSLRKIQSRAA